MVLAQMDTVFYGAWCIAALAYLSVEKMQALDGLTWCHEPPATADFM
jgi:hypothetical protein